MTIDFSSVIMILSNAVPSVTPGAQLTVRYNGQSVFSRAYGYLDPETCLRPVQRTSLFDLASLTKLFTSTAFMRLVEDGLTELDELVSTVLPEFSGLRPVLPYEDPHHAGNWVDITGQAHKPDREIQTVDASKITFRQILRHSAGLPAWRPLKDQPDATSAVQMVLGTFFSYLPDSRVLYSDIGMILLGLAVARITRNSLQRVISEQVTAPLGLARTRFLPVGTTIPLEVAPTEYCAWRKRRISGEVHDESACRLGGIAGHAGLFSTADEIARFGQSFLAEEHPPAETGPLTRPLKPETIAEMVRQSLADEHDRRGLGFALWTPDPQASSYPFSQAAFGHTGFTGTSLWIDPKRHLVVALLTNEIYFGRSSRKIGELRLAVHQSVIQTIDQAQSNSLS